MGHINNNCGLQSTPIAVVSNAVRINSGAGVGGCRVCNQSVFLAQRLLISGHLFHRTCFKCARCGALLSVANYYETQDGKYCCETCPDEEERLAPTAEVVDGVVVDQAPKSARPPSLVSNRRALFETLAAADCTDDVKASKKAQRPTTLRMAEPTAAAAAEDCKVQSAALTACSDDNDSGVVVVSDKKELPADDAKTATRCATASVSASGSRETLSDMVVDESCSKDDAVVPDDKSVPVVRPPSPAPLDSVTPAPHTEFSAAAVDPVTGVVDGNIHADDDVSRPELIPENQPSCPVIPSPRNVLVDEAPAADVRPPTAVDDDHVPMSDDLKQVLNDAASEKLLQADSPEEDLEIKTLANKLLKMDYYESDKVVPVPSPRKKIKSPIKINYPENLNPFDDQDDDDVANEKHNSTNPFGSDLEDEEEPPTTKTKCVVGSNPFSSDEEENETSIPPPMPKPRTTLSPMLKPQHQTHRKQSSASSISSFSSTPRKKKPAPPPPKTRQSLGNIEYANNTQLSSPNSLEDSSCSGSEPSSSVTNNEDRYRLHKSTHGKWKRKKGPAPQCPIPQRRRIKPMPIEDIKQELLDIEIKQQELERQGVKLEKDIRLKCNEDLNNVDVEEMVLQLFELVNEKNELFRKHAELMYLRRQHNLEEEHAELEYQIRVLMARPEHTKTDSEKAREEELIQRLVEVVGRRNEIVENLERDRLREFEEDRSVFNQIGTFAQDETLPCIKPVDASITDSKKNFSKRLLKNIKKVKSKKDKPEDSSPSKSPSNNSSYSKGTLKKFMSLGHSSKKYLRPKSS